MHGLYPSIKLKKHSSKERLHLTITNPNISAAFTESIRNLRVKLIKYMDDRRQQVLLITSTMPNEGKSTIATNLALSLASEGKRVILIDGDLRKQALKRRASASTSRPTVWPKFCRIRRKISVCCRCPARRWCCSPAT